jgi:hypothetical protein
MVQEYATNENGGHYFKKESPFQCHCLKEESFWMSNFRRHLGRVIKLSIPNLQYKAFTSTWTKVYN